MKTLIVDDDLDLADVLSFTLRRAGFEVIVAHDGQMALERWRAENPDLIVLDLNLPRLDGLSVCQQIRAEADTPIIILSVRDEEDDIVKGLTLGADDYITKPFSPRQLIARVQAVLRRASQLPAAALQQVGELSFDPGRRELRIGGGEALSLTPLEARLLGYLMLNANRVLTIEALIDHIWGPAGADRDMLRQLVHRLRGKIEPDPAQPVYIETVPGLGYGLIVEVDAKG
jgi:DNA-binding response OmpR family regulator